MNPEQESCFGDEGDTDIDAISHFDAHDGTIDRKIGAAWDSAPPDWDLATVRDRATAGQEEFDSYLLHAEWLEPTARILYASLPLFLRQRGRASIADDSWIFAGWIVNVPPADWGDLRAVAHHGDQEEFDGHILHAAWITAEQKADYELLSPLFKQRVRTAALGLAP
jgi:hypothetical protein